VSSGITELGYDQPFDARGHTGVKLGYTAIAPVIVDGPLHHPGQVIIITGYHLPAGDPHMTSGKTGIARLIFVVFQGFGHTVGDLCRNGSLPRLGFGFSLVVFFLGIHFNSIID